MEIKEPLWTLKKELKYFEKLGNFSSFYKLGGNSNAQKADYKYFLQSKYIETFEKRTDWGGIDKKKLYFAIINASIKNEKGIT